MSEQLQTFQGCPQPQSSRLIDFERAEVRVLPNKESRYLVLVSGTKPCINMKVELIPLVYIEQPEYWGIEVVGSLPGGICLPAIAPYNVDLLDPPLGIKGIEIIGASRRQIIEIPPQTSPQSSFTLSITSKATGALVGEASLTCGPAGGSHPNPEVACKQLTRADGHIEAIPADEGPCTKEFNPVILRASGTWNGQDRRFEGEFPNRCVGVRATGGVIFDFESTASSKQQPTTPLLLPKAVGRRMTAR